MQNEATYFDETCSSTIVLKFLSHSASINFFFWTPFLFCFARLSYSLESSVIFRVQVACFWVSDCFLCFFWILWMLGTVSKLVMSQVSRVATDGTTFTQASFRVSNEISPILVTRFLDKNYHKLEKRLLSFRPKITTRRKKRRW